MLTAAEINDAMQDAFGAPTAFYRDTTLPHGHLGKYQPGVILREPTYCDASHKFGGLVAPHRYMIISSNARCLDEHSAHPEWGLCVWLRNSLFKVLDNTTIGGFSQILMLEIPAPLLDLFQTGDFPDLEKEFVTAGRMSFSTALKTPPVPDLNTQEWRDRLAYPIGIDDKGEYYDL